MNEDKRIAELTSRLTSPLPSLDESAFHDSARKTLDWCMERFLSLGDRPIGRSASRWELEEILREPLPEEGVPFDEVIETFRREIVPRTMSVGHPRFLAFIPSAPNFLSILGEWLCAGLNCFAGVWMEGAGAAQIELLVLDWFKEILGYPSGANGILTEGGSGANLTALVVARQRLSLEERRRAVLYQSDQRHYSLDKAAMVIGLASDQIRKIPSDESFKLPSDGVAKAIHEDRNKGLVPWAVIANAGTTNTGAVDSLNQLCQLCRREQLWLHVDAAYGWTAALSERGKALLHGVEHADSITLDPHKWFAQTYDAGCLLVREGRLLAETFGSRPEYLQDVAPTGEEVNFADHGIALTRRFRALKLWLAIKVLGIRWYRQLVDHCMGLAELLEALLLREKVFEILSPRELSIVCFRYHPTCNGVGNSISEEELNGLNERMLEELRKTGRFFSTSTRLRGCFALRCCFVNWRTTSADVHELVETLVRISTNLE